MPHAKNSGPTPVTLAAATVLAATLVAPARAGECPPAGFEGEAIDLSTDPTTQRRAPAAAYNAVDGQYMVVWFDTRNPGNNDVFGQRLSAAGDLLEGNVAIMEFADAQVDPAIAHNSAANEYLAAWRTQQAGFFNRARGRRLGADGAPLDDDFFIGEGFEMSLLYNAAEDQYLHTGRLPGIRGQRVSGAGVLVGGPIVIASAGAPAPNGGAALDTTNNRYFATWRDQVDQNLQGQLVAADGTLVGDPVLISPLFAKSGRAAAVAYDATNERFLVVFGVFQENRILGQLVGADGAPDGDNFPIVSGLASRPSPALAFSPTSGLYVMAYTDGGTVHVVLLDADGAVCDATTADANAPFGIPAIAHNGDDDEFLIAWVDDRNLGEGEQDIYAQILRLRGCPADIDGSGAVDFGDILAILAAWGDEGGPEDVDGSGVVDFGDILVVLAEWGPC